MNKRMIKSKLRCLRRILLLCLCAVLLTGSALAEDVADISGEGFDCMYYKCTLPDGRVILTGCKGTVGNYIDSRARILCLNPDMTVSWDKRQRARNRFFKGQKITPRFNFHCFMKIVAVIGAGLNPDGLLSVFFGNGVLSANGVHVLKFV